MIVSKNTLEKYLENQVQISTKDLSIIRSLDDTKDNRIELDPSKVSIELLRFIIFNDTVLDYETKANLSSKYLSITSEPKVNNDFWNVKIKGLNTIIEIFEGNLKNTNYNFDLLLDNRFISVYVNIDLFNATKYDERRIVISYYLKFTETYFKYESTIRSENILSLKKIYPSLSFKEFMNFYNLYPQKQELSKFNELIVRARNIELKSGEQFIVNGNGIEIKDYNRFDYNPLQIHKLNLSFGASKVIIEKDLEVEKDRREIPIKNQNDVPYVRVFSLAKKRFYYVHVENLIPYKYNLKASEKLVLPEKSKQIVSKLFSANQKATYDDIVSNKGGGLIVLAEGEPGTGKTSTAEVYAETVKKPLYILQVDELGTTVSDLERRLTTILNRIQKWDAILLFDEVDIFLSHRNDNLEKSAIVGVFLRLFEYFNGIIFFTTNKENSIDEAVLNRVTLKIKYPRLDKLSREKIWKLNLEQASLRIDSISKISEMNINGREIRNLVKLLSILYDKEVKENQILELMENFPKK